MQLEVSPAPRFVRESTKQHSALLEDLAIAGLQSPSPSTPTWPSPRRECEGQVEVLAATRRTATSRYLQLWVSTPIAPSLARVVRFAVAFTASELWLDGRKCAYVSPAAGGALSGRRRRGDLLVSP